jgi:hypothetical protein
MALTSRKAPFWPLGADLVSREPWGKRICRNGLDGGFCQEMDRRRSSVGSSISSVSLVVPGLGPYKRQCGRSPLRLPATCYGRGRHLTFAFEMLVEGCEDDVLDISCRHAGDRSDFCRLGLSMQARQRDIIAIMDAGLGCMRRRHAVARVVFYDAAVKGADPVTARPSGAMTWRRRPRPIFIPASARRS